MVLGTTWYLALVSVQYSVESTVYRTGTEIYLEIFSCIIENDIYQISTNMKTSNGFGKGWARQWLS